jgi:hypothetical protein
MAKNPKKIRKKMVDITLPVPLQSKVKKSESRKIEEEFKKLDKKIEEFEKKEEKQFKKEEKRRKVTAVTYALLGASLVLLGVGLYLAVEFLPRAEIKVITKKTEWNYVDSIIADKNIAKIDTGQKQIPAEIFSVKKNFNFSFPATGKKSVEQKASGKITIYNAYSSDPQILVANTRFLTPDGKTFRLEQKIVVPGAKIVEGKIIPSNIEAKVIADQPGPQYNIGPVSHFSIPGFQGSVKYQGFYASSQEPMTGGFVGEKAFPTDEDIKKAREKAMRDLKDYVESFLSLQIPSEFKIIDGSKQFNLLKEEINKEVDEKGNFTVFLEGESLNIAFKESDLENLLENIAKDSLGVDFKIKTYKLEYGAGRADFRQGKISFAINFQGVFEKPLDIESFRQKALNKNEKELKTLVSSLPNIQKVTISFWPFWVKIWVKRVPDDLKRVKIGVE